MSLFRHRANGMCIWHVVLSSNTRYSISKMNIIVDIEKRDAVYNIKEQK